MTINYINIWRDNLYAWKLNSRLFFDLTF